MTHAKTPIYMSDELEHANKMREQMVPQVEAARAMLAALKEAQGELAQFEVTLPEVDAAIARAEAAGIKAEG